MQPPYSLKSMCSKLQMLLFPNALCCSLYEHNCVCASHQNFYEIFTRKQFLPTSAGNAQAQLHFCGNAQAQLHFRDDQQRAFGISNISNCIINRKWLWATPFDTHTPPVEDSANVLHMGSVIFKWICW